MKLSVALCTYNGSCFLEEQLDSILNQTIAIDEIVICDDNSSDGTIGIITSYQNKYPGIIYFHQNNPALGTISNFEKAISHTKGDLIFLSDQDDIWYPEKVEKMLSYFKSNKKCQLLFTDGDLIDDLGEKLNGGLWEKWKFDLEKKASWNNNALAFKDLINGNNKITGATVCFDKILKNVIFPFEFPSGYWHDNWLGVHSAAADGLFFIEEPLIQYRIHPNQQVGINPKVVNTLITNDAKRFISKEKYFKKLKKAYPHLKQYIPNQKINILKKILFKIKRVLSS